MRRAAFQSAFAAQPARWILAETNRTHQSIVGTSRIGLARPAALLMNGTAMHMPSLAASSFFRHALRCALAFLLLFATPAFAEDPSIVELRLLMKKVADEMMAGKADSLAAHTHPALVTLLGGEKKAKVELPKMMSEEMKKLEDLGFRIKSYSAAPPENLRTAGDWTFALIPTTMVTEGAKGTLTMKSHILACRKVGETKWYLFRLGLPEAQVRSLLPEIPADYTWPVKEPPKFEPK